MQHPTSPKEHLPPGELDQVAACLDALNRGLLVGLPTESNYCVAVLGDGEAQRELLRQGVDAGRAMDWVRGFDSSASAEVWASPWLPPARRLAARYWPGPLVLVLPSSPEKRLGVGDDWVSLRVPASRIARAVLGQAGKPVLLTPASSASGPAARTLTELPAPLRARLGFAARGDEPTVGQDPAAVRVGPGRFDIIREGILTSADILRTAGRRILFVCTGNTCRSPMAEAVARELLVVALGGARGLSRPQQVKFLVSFGYRIESAGIGPPVGSPPSVNAVLAAREAGLSIEDHAAKSVNAVNLAEFDLVLTMGERHKAWLEDMGIGNVKVERLIPDRDVDDPYGGPLSAYRGTLDLLRAQIEARLPELL